MGRGRLTGGSDRGLIKSERLEENLVVFHKG